MLAAPKDIIHKIFTYVFDSQLPAQHPLTIHIVTISKIWYEYLVERAKSAKISLADAKIKSLPAMCYSMLSFEQQIELPNLLIRAAKSHNINKYLRFKHPIDWQDIVRFVDSKEIAQRLFAMRQSRYYCPFPTNVSAYFIRNYTRYYQFRIYIKDLLKGFGDNPLCKNKCSISRTTARGLNKLIIMIWNYVHKCGLSDIITEEFDR